MKFAAFILFMGVGFYVNAQISVSHLQNIPRIIKYKGKLLDALYWKDNLGENILITSKYGPYEVKIPDFDEPGTSAEIYVYHYNKKDSAYKLLWKMRDFVKKCSFDLTLAFIKESLSITDLDNNGIAESTIIYKLACRGDVSPAYLKVIMHENSIKYGLRGNMWVHLAFEDTAQQFNITEKDVNLENLPKKKDEIEAYFQSLGHYENEKDFNNAPKEFLNFAREQWLKYVKESFEY